MNVPKISVIIPVYNSRKYLSQCLDSLRCQTLTDIEIICVNDRSTDNSADIIAGYAQTDDRVILLSQPNAGAGAARNKGMSAAKGRYLSFLDADDFFEPDMLEKAYNAAEGKKADVAVYGCDIYENGRFSPCNYSIRHHLLPASSCFAATDIKKDVFKAFVGWAWDKLFRTDFIRENDIRFQEQRTTNDMLFVFSALVKAERITVVPDVLAHYRREEGSLSVTREKSWHCFYDALVALKQQLLSWGIYERFHRDYINYCVHFSLWNLETLARPAHTLLYNKLRDEWFESLGVLQYDKDFFYNEKEYSEYRWIVEHTADESKTKEYISAVKKLERKEKITKFIISLKEKGIIYTVKLIINKLISK